MNDTFDRDLADWLGDGPERGSGEGLERTLAATRRVSQRPGWSLPERWIHPELTMTPTSTRRPLLALTSLILLLGALLSAALLTGSQQRQAPSLYRNGAVVYEHRGDLFIADQLGGTPRPLVAGPEQDSDPVFSPKGDRIAFVREGSGLMTVRPDGSDLTELAQAGHPDTFDWSPDGAAILATTNSENDLEVIQSDGSGYRTLEVGGRPASASWRPGARQIAFVRTRGDRSAFIADADGTNARELPVGPAQSLAWSADGMHLSFVIPCAGQCRPIGVGIAEIAEDGAVTGLRRLGLAAWSAIWTDAKWSPDGSQLAFVVRSDSALRVGVADADGSAFRLVGPELFEHRVIDLTWAPDGRSLVIFDAPASPSTSAPSNDEGAAVVLGAKASSIDVATGEQTEIRTPAESWQRLAP